MKSDEVISRTRYGLALLADELTRAASGEITPGTERLHRWAKLLGLAIDHLGAIAAAERDSAAATID